MIITLMEQLNVIEQLFDSWQLLDVKGLSDEVVNRLLHYLIDKIHRTYEKGSTEPKIKVT